MSEYPPELIDTKDERIKAGRIGRWLVLQEMGFFGDKTNLVLARGEYTGTFTAAVRKRFSGLYGNVGGCDAADLEVAAEMLGVFEDVYNLEVEIPDGARA